MKIAVIGSGISGISAAWGLSKQHEVSLFESADRLGGHTHTHDLQMAGKTYRVDSGFIVHNPENYPLFCAFLDELQVPTQATEMSFAVHNQATGMYYNAHSLATLFCQKRNLFSPKFHGMIHDIRRFYRECPALLKSAEDGPSLGQYLQQNRYGAMFINNHLIPMASALWSSPNASILEFPAKYLVAFMNNHHMLQISNRPLWRVLANGSKSYIEAVEKKWRVAVRLNANIVCVKRAADGVSIHSPDGVEIFDQVIFACHSDQALNLLDAPTQAETDILGAIRYQDNETILHHDASVLPQDRKAWAAWNAHISDAADRQCTVSYCMNILQGMQSPEPFIVSLNQRGRIDPAKILAVMHYQHPVYSHEMIRAQRRRHEINGHNRSWFCGAYWGFGFHEDGFRSGHEVAQALLHP